MERIATISKIEGKSIKNVTAAALIFDSEEGSDMFL
jgi:hypothetical protein